MTAQSKEKLTYKGKVFGMATEPLNGYLVYNNIKFVSQSTGCWRGYIGEWIIEDNKLYLVNISAYIENYTEVGLDYLFPNDTKVFARWFSGEIRIPHGNMIKYVHIGYASLFEKELYLTFQNGILIGEREIDNSKKYHDLNSRETSISNDTNVNIQDFGDNDLESDHEQHHFFESEFAGTYASDIEGYSDDDIYDIFDGQPDAYWNID